MLYASFASFVLWFLFRSGTCRHPRSVDRCVSKITQILAELVSRIVPLFHVTLLRFIRV